LHGALPPAAPPAEELGALEGALRAALNAGIPRALVTDAIARIYGAAPSAP